MKYIVMIMLLLIPITCKAEQKYNAFTDTWETTSSDSEMKYDAINDEWGYHEPEARQEYNSNEEKWEWNGFPGRSAIKKYNSGR